MAEIGEIKVRVGAALRAARRARGLTQEALAAAVECSVETLSNAERGQSLPSLELFLALVQTLDIDLAALVDAPRVTGKVSKERLRMQGEAGRLAIGLDDEALKRWIEVGRVFERE